MPKAKATSVLTTLMFTDIVGSTQAAEEIRAGVHIGECEVFDRKLSGVNVHVAARTMAEAGAGQVIVTGGVRDLVRGAGFVFADGGTHELQGVAGEWHLLEVAKVDGAPRPRPLTEQESRSRRDYGNLEIVNSRDPQPG